VIESAQAEGTASGDAEKRSVGRPRDEGADARILRAAAGLMLERGVPEVTVDEVAELAMVGKATVYRRFRSKTELATCAVESLFRTHVAIPNSGSFRTDMELVYIATIMFAASPVGNAFLRLATSAACRSRKTADIYRRAYEGRRDEFGVIIDRALVRGELSEDLSRSLFFDSLPALLVFRTITNQPLPPLDSVPALVDGMLNALDEWVGDSGSTVACAVSDQGAPEVVPGHGASAVRTMTT
jgi:AcrR family transcriptional regulator